MLILPDHNGFSHNFVDIDLKSAGDILNTSYMNLRSYDFFQLIDQIRILIVQFDKTKKILPAAAEVE